MSLKALSDTKVSQHHVALDVFGQVNRLAESGEHGVRQSLDKALMQAREWVMSARELSAEEAADLAEALRREGCDLMQGYHFAPPLAADEFARRLRG